MALMPESSGLENYLPDCIDNYTHARKLYPYYCITPGTYTLASFGKRRQIGITDQPTLEFQVLRTKFHSRELAEDLGDITELGNITSQPDTFSCLDNPNLDLLACNEDYNKLIYRQFYLSEASIVKIGNRPDRSRCGGGEGYLRLFRGRANDLNSTLEPWQGQSGFNQKWETCFTCQQTSECTPLTPGWYTVVSYGRGASYEEPSFVPHWSGPTSIGDRYELGERSDLWIEILPATIAPAKFNRPHKAYIVNDGNPIVSEPLTGNLQRNTSNYLELEQDVFACLPDTPLDQHPLLACDSTFNRVAYYTFQLGEQSMLTVEGIQPDFGYRLYDFNVRVDSSLLIQRDPIGDCVTTRSKLQFCNLQPGWYTLVVMGTDRQIGYGISPNIRIDRSGISRFDHALNAYDFGLIRNDGVPQNGKEGDIHPTNPNFPASHDNFYCSTGAQLTDPEHFPCWVSYNPDIYPPQQQQVLVRDTFSGSHLDFQRNLWYTFKLSGSGKATVSLVDDYGWSLLTIFESDVDGSLSFNEVINGGMVDSTETDGLKFLGENRQYSCSDNQRSFSFDKTACERDEVRYYIMVSTAYQYKLVRPVAISVTYEGVPTFPRLYDHYSTANLVNGLDEVDEPYTEVALTPGIYNGAPASLQCATRDPIDAIGDPSHNNRCITKSVWYKFKTEGSGIMRLAYEQIGGAADFERNNMVLFHESVEGDSTSLSKVGLDYFYSNNQANDTGHNWGETCYMPSGTYYVMISNCYDHLDILSEYRPIIWLDDSEAQGDYCGNAIPISLNGTGEVITNMRVRCQTLGEDFGEDGSNLGCLFGPENYKSGWFKLTITGSEKYDVTFDMQERTSALPQDIRYRILYGDCSAMTAGPCNSDANTTFTLNCMKEGDYFVQVVIPSIHDGNIELKINSVLSPDQTCRPLDPLAPTANFTSQASCESDSVYFLNQSTQGEEISYIWTLPNGASSRDFNTEIVYPRTNDFQTFDVTLQVTNNNRNTTDEVTIPVTIPPRTYAFNIRDTTICDDNPLQLALDVPQATYRWPDGSTGSTYLVSSEQDVWVELTTPTCIIVDSLYVNFELCDIEKDTSVNLCPGGIFQGQFIERDTMIIDSIPLPAGNYQINFTNITITDLSYQEVDTIYACAGEVVNLLGIPITSDTTVCEIFTSLNGCDTTYCTVAQFFEVPRTELQVTICPGESYQIGNMTLDRPGRYETVLTSENGCDSMVVAELSWHERTKPIISGSTILCKDGTVNLSVQSGFTNYHWLHNDNSSASIQVNEPGIYEVVVTSIQGCLDTASIEVMLTDIRLQTQILSDYDGWPNSCTGKEDASIETIITGGTAPYTILWNNGSSDSRLDQIGPGNYYVTVTDVDGCSQIDSILVMDRPAIEGFLDSQNPICLGEASGYIMAEVVNALPPFDFKLNDGVRPTAGFFDLKAGDYTIEISDRFGCTWSESIVLEDPPLLKLTMPARDITVKQGDSLVLAATSTVETLAKVNWEPAVSICDTCLQPMIRPLESELYTLKVVDNNGCSDEASIFVVVDKTLRIYLPNAFSPDGNGTNEVFLPYPSSQVSKINTFQVYNRWGTIMHNRKNLIPPLSDTDGWDGTFDGQLVSAGVYIYMVEIELVDGKIEVLSGELVLMR